MLTQKKKSLPTATSAIARNIENATQKGESYSEDERLNARKADMLQLRQVHLDILMDSHDDLVREAFQLDKFVTLLSYDPKVAKNDNSQVFLEYKAPHDLLSKMATTSGAGHNARKTRRAITESRESLVATISGSPTAPPVTPSSTPAKVRGKVISRLDPVSSLGKNLEKRRTLVRNTPLPRAPSAAREKGKGKELHTSPTSTEVMAMPPPPSPAPVPSKRAHHPRRAKDSSAEPSVLGSIAHSRSLTRTGVSSSSSQTSLRPEATRRFLRDSTRGPIAVDFEPSESLEHAPASQKLTIKRIRLFQRPPPVVYTHPSQLPPRPMHRGSIGEFLISYTSLEDGVDLTTDELERDSFVEAKTRVRIRDLRRQGRLLLEIPDLPDGSIGIPLTGPDDRETHEVLRTEDHYDHLVSAASRRALTVATNYAAKRAVAKKIAKLVLAWHANKESTEEKQQKAEAVRLKTLAKFTIKEVEKQWKKAVMAVREHNRAILEAEEARLGRKHLDAILDQSGAILEAQHTDLSRTRSRSSSAIDRSGESDDDSQYSQDQADSEYPDEGTDVEKEDGADVTWLLGEDTINSLGSGDPGSDVEDPAVSEIDELRSRGSYPGESLPLSEASSDVLPEIEEKGPSLSRSPCEVALDDRLLIDAEAPSASSLDDTATESAIKSNKISQEDHASEEFLMDPAALPQEEGQSTDPPKSSYQPMGYRNPGSKSRDNRDTSTTPSSPSPFHSRSPQLRPQISPPGHPGASSYAIRADDYVDQPEKTESPSELDGHKAVAVRLSNGVVIYRDIETHSQPEEFSSVSFAASKANGRNLGSPANEDSSGVTRKCSPGITAETQKNDTPQANSSGSSHVDDPTRPETSSTAHMGANGTEKEIIDVEAGSQGQRSVAALDVNGAEDLAADGPQVAPHLVDFAAAPVEWDATSKVNPSFLLRGTLRPYQQSGLEWLASLHTNNLNGILADEMGLGKTIQTISLLAHLACDRGIWGPHLIVVPTSVLLNWEMEFKKFLPGFKILSYHGSTKRRKELRVGWNNKHSFNVCVTSYTLASRDAHIFKRKSWYYMVLDEAHMIKNFKSQRWNILLMFRSFRRLLLTGTPLQNNLTELWALLQFLMSGTNFANLKEFGDWFSNPLEKAIEQGTVLDEETQERVRKLHTVLRPYLLRRLKADVEKELPSKYEHLVMCRLSKRQRFLYDEFMSRAQTRDALASGVYHQVANILMQLRKVCNHPDLFEVRPIVTSFAMPRSATIDFEIKELLVRRRFLRSKENTLNLDFLGLVFVQHQGKSMMQARSTRALDASSCLPFITELPGEPPPVDTRTIEGFKRHAKHQRQLAALRQWTHISYSNRLRCAASPVYGSETISAIRSLKSLLAPLSEADFHHSDYLDRSSILPTLIKSYEQREEDMGGLIDRFAFVTPPVVARDMSSIALSGFEHQILCAQETVPKMDAILRRATVKLQIAFPDSSLIQYDCGKLQELASLLRKRKAGGHRVLIFTQMTKVLDILEIFLNFHGYRYLRLDGATKIEDRQYITERFNNDDRVFTFIASSRSGGVGINLTGADTVVFYDSDFNPQMDRQCEDRAHRIGQIRDVHIYRFISEHTVEESMLRKANQKRSLDNIVIQQGEFDWRNLLIDDEAFGRALGEFEDKEDAHAARVAAREEAAKEVEDNADFAGEVDDATATETGGLLPTAPEEEEREEEGTIADYMLTFVKRDWEFFFAWR